MLGLRPVRGSALAYGALDREPRPPSIGISEGGSESKTAST